MYCIYNYCFVKGVGTVVSGTCMQGVVRLNDTLLLGPNGLGEFLPVVVRGIQRKRLPVSMVRGGQTASFALKKVSNTMCHCIIVAIKLCNYTCTCIMLTDQTESDTKRNGNGGSHSQSICLLGV